MIATVLALALTTRASLEFSHPIDRAEVVFAALSEAVGVTIRPSGALPDDRIYVRLRDTDWESAKPMLAEGLRSEWRQRGETLYLHREPYRPATDPEERTAESLRKWQKIVKVEDDYSDRTSIANMLALVEEFRIARQQDDYFKVVEDFVVLQDYEKPFAGIRGVLAPGVRALIQLLPLLDPDEIAALIDEPQTFASLEGKARDIRLPASAAPILSRFWKERQALREVIEVVPGNRILVDRLARRDDPVPDETAPLVLIDVDDTWISLTLIVPSSGELNRVGTIIMQTDPLLVEGHEWREDAYPSLTGALRLSREQDVTARFVEQPNRFSEETPLLDDESRAYAMSLLADPVSNDPLALLCQPILEQAAAARDVSMVALLSDVSIFHSHWAGRENLTLGEALSTLVTGVWSAESVEKDGYWLLYPRDLSILEDMRLDRDQIKRFIERSLASDAVTLENLTSLSKSATSRSGFDHALWYVNTVLEYRRGYRGVEAVPLLASLGAGVIREMRREGYTVLGTELPGDMQKWILKSLSNLSEKFDDEPLDVGNLGFANLSGSSVDQTRRNDRHTLLALRDGMPSGVRVHLRLVREPTMTVRMVTDGKIVQRSTFEFTFDRYARSLDSQRQEDKDGPAARGTVIDFMHVSLGFRETFYAIVGFPGLGFTDHGVRLSTGRLRPEFVAFSDLPANIKSQIEEIIKRNNDGGGGVRP